MSRRMRARSMVPIAELAMTRAEERFLEWELSIPVRVDVILAVFKASLEMGTLPETCPEVTLTDSDGTKLVVIRANDPVSRQRFSAAHALGHLDLHQGRSICLPGEKQYVERVRETEANAFAAALLMPRAEFMYRLGRALGRMIVMPVDATALIEVEARQRMLSAVGHEFGVSREAVFYRICDLGLLAESLTIDEWNEAVTKCRRDTKRSEDDPYGQIDDDEVPF